MKDQQENKGKKSKNEESSPNKKKSTDASTHTEGSDKKHELYERWKDPKSNTMGNNIAAELKIANSKGEMEGGSDNRWHMKEGSESDGSDDEIGN